MGVMADETAVANWQTTHPVAHRIYWTLRAAMEEQDGRKKANHHRAAVVAIHESFGSKPDRDRLGLPATMRELAEAFGVSARTLRKAREEYAAIFQTTQETIRQAFVGTYYGRVYEALGESAATPDYHNSADRRLFLQVAGDLTDKVDVTSKGEQIDPIRVYIPSNGREVDDGD